MSSRSLQDLNQFTRQAAIVHQQLCKAKGIDLLIYGTLRSNAEQDALYAIGRTKPGDIVTKARAGESAHNPDVNGQASAYDCVGMIGGKAMWAPKHPFWPIIGACAEEAGLAWAGRWTGSLRESAHCQDPSWVKPTKK